MTRPATALALLATAALLPAAEPSELTRALDAVLDRPDYKSATWGTLAVDVKTGGVLYERNADTLCAPASTAKLFSCAAAWADLGPDYRFKTPVVRRGDVLDGVLAGDLILVASGDLTLGGRDRDGAMAFADDDHTYAGPRAVAKDLTDTDPLAGLDDLARQVAKAGVKRVSGDVLVDDRLFERESATGSGPGVVTPVLVNDNLIDFVVTPAAEAGAAAAVTTRPAAGFVQVDAQVKTAGDSAASRVEVVAVGPYRYALRGQVGRKARPALRVAAVDDPAGFARNLFVEALRRAGVEVDSTALSPARAALPPRDEVAKLPRLAEHESLPLREAVKVTLKVSHNLYASTLPMLLAVKAGGRTLPAGLRRQREVLAELGVTPARISLGGGAGGSPADAVTARETVALLRKLSARPDWAEYADCLPVLGVDGTLADTVPPDSPARGKARAKTGTLFWADGLNGRSLLRSKALAGVVRTEAGRDVLFAAFVNNVPLPPGVPPSREGKVLGHLCELIWRHAGE